ncbi:ThiF family adenylyltransferase [Arsenicicoccus piscis]|uniref:ThiF family adenylyltransferase n=1 Tax=Arsenicicoccus piscis TaxID=673954 RepID=UPI001F4D0017|nr:ThiF family adenylyltransferase [Arsenicicoccus piscis]MCH8628229.1 ThiF family adenylyltransferase [Arsenicicoccus piscis]
MPNPVAQVQHRQQAHQGPQTDVARARARRGVPLVEPGPPLGEAERARYARHLLLPEIGEIGQRRLGAARVLVVGAGGLGSPALLYLAAAGIGTIGIVDDDVVERSNLQRQVVHGEADLGRLKVDSAAETVAAVNPLVTVVRHPQRLVAANAEEILAGYDVVLDGSDSFATRYLVNDACVLLGIPHVWASVLRFQGQASVWGAADGPCYRCVFPEPPPAGSVPSCAEAGVLGVTCSALAAAQGAEVVKLVTGSGAPLIGRLLLHDALAATWSELPVRRNPDCQVCAPGREVRLADLEASVCAVAVPPAPDVSDVPVVSPTQLQSLLVDRAAGAAAVATAAGAARPAAVRLVDVRTAAEREIVTIDGAEHVPLEEILDGRCDAVLARDDDLVLHCRSGVRSEQAGRALLDRGYRHVRHLDGGILAWVDEIEPERPRY